MPERMIPRYASDYTSEQLDRVYRTLRQVALVLQDFQDSIVLVGGLVPLFLTDQMALAQDDHSHIGTVDVDLGIHLGLIAGERYEELEQRLDHLEGIGFRTDTESPNVRLLIPDDEGLYDHSYIERISDLPVVSPLQVYVDLKHEPERSEEMAEALLNFIRNERL